MTQLKLQKHNPPSSFGIEDVPALIAEWRNTDSPRMHHLADQLQAMYDTDTITLGDAPNYKPPKAKAKPDTATNK